MPHCAGWSRLHTLKGLRTREEASLVRCKTVVPLAGLGLAHGRLVCVCALTRARHCARSLWGGGAARARATRARRGVAPRSGEPLLRFIRGVVIEIPDKTYMSNSITADPFCLLFFFAAGPSESRVCVLRVRIIKLPCFFRLTRLAVEWAS